MRKRFLSIVVLMSMVFSIFALKADARSTTPKSLLVFGDSISTGYGLADKSKSFSRLLAQKLGIPDSQYVNLAENGATSSDILNKVKASTKEIAAADTIFLTAGGNDVLGILISNIKIALGLPDDATIEQVQEAIRYYNILSVPMITTQLQKAEVQAQFNSAEIGFANNLISIVKAIKAANPDAKLYVQTVYNPLDALSLYKPLASITQNVLGAINTTIRTDASTNYKVIDTYTAFKGKSLFYTNIADLDIHPNQEGHSVICGLAYDVIIKPIVTYTTYMQKTGWQGFVSNGASSNKKGKLLPCGAFKIKLSGNIPAGASIIYQAYIQKKGWQKSVSNGMVAGATGKSLKLEALRVTLSGLAGYKLQYNAYVQKKGWMGWRTTKNGTGITKAGIAGVTGRSLAVEAIKIKILKAA